MNAPVSAGTASLQPQQGSVHPGTDAARWAAALAELGPQGAAASQPGHFAIGLDLPGAETFLAVDRFATRSLCYRLVDGRLRFAERADELADSTTPIDPQAIFDYLYFHVIPSPRTVYQGIHRLPPGHYAHCVQGRLTVAPYWSMSFAPDSRRPLAELRDEFRGLLRQAIQRQLDGSKPACFLSGGTDSSTVAGMIGEVTGRPAATYAIGFDAAGYDEMRYARIAARHFGTEHHEYYVTPDDLVQTIGKVAASYEQPFGNSSALPAYHCALQARADGVTRLLGGDGGDELFGGNSRYALQRIFGWYEKFPKALRGAVLEPLFGSQLMRRVPLLRAGAGYIRYARTPMPDRLQLHNWLNYLGVDQVLSPALLERVDVGSALEQQRAVWANVGAQSDIDRALAFDWRYTLAENDLPKVRGTSRLAGVDVGFPLLDSDLLRFSMKLPADHKLRGLRLRWFFKEALRGFLPNEIITKKKHGFGLPFGVWALRHPPLHRLAADSVRAVAARGIVQAAFANALIDTHLPAHPGYHGEIVWVLMMLEQWLRAHAPDYRCA